MNIYSMYFTKTELQCKCSCTIYNIDSILLHMLNTIRIMRNKPIIITSACRCPSHNTRVNGNSRSLHITTPTIPCRAVDIAVTNKQDRMEIVQFATKLHFTGIGISHSFIHLSYAPDYPEGLYSYS